MIKREPTMRVRRSCLQDWYGIEALVRKARYTSPALWPWETYLTAGGFVVVEVGRRIEGALLASSDESPVAWVRLAVVSHRLDVERWLDISLPPVVDYLRARGVRQLVWMDHGGWERPYLVSRGFDPHTEVITLSKHDRTTPDVAAVPVRLRPAANDDFPALAALDRRAFPPTWWRSAASMKRRARTSSRFSVVEHQGQVIGYAERELHPPAAHLNRIAVAPAYQSRGIGALLLKDALAQMWRGGAEMVSLNTQRSNRRSCRLYERFGFTPTGDGVIVWALRL